LVTGGGSLYYAGDDYGRIRVTGGGMSAELSSALHRRDVRSEAGDVGGKLTHADLAERSGLPRTAVTGILSGSLQKVMIDRVLRLVEAAGANDLLSYPHDVPGSRSTTEYEFTVVIERDEDGRYLAICPGLQGCYPEGKTEDEARALIQDAIRLHVEDRIAAGEPIYREVGSTKVRIAV
jgi:predicted RNase H-like HicB family nuclease